MKDQPYQIILIDDNHTTNFLNEMVINRSGHGFGIRVFDKAANAIDFFKDKKNHEKRYLVFLDINMPEMDGWEFADEYAKINGVKKNAIVMLTSSVDPRDEERALSHSIINDYHPKPLSFEVLNKVLEKHF